MSDDRCPKCGAAWQSEQWQCGSYPRGTGQTFGADWLQSNECRIRELQRDLAAANLRAEAAERERDEALHLLNQWKGNPGGLRLSNGTAIGWCRDEMAGFIAGIGGDSRPYPTILEAIRAALAKGTT